jgi:hypothetical protein
MALVAAPAAVGLALVAGGVVNLLYGQPYAEAATPLRLLAAALLPLFMNALLSWAVLARGRASWLPRLTAVRVAAAVAFALSLVPPLGAVGAAAGLALAEWLLLGPVGVPGVVLRPVLAPWPGARDWPMALAVAGSRDLPRGRSARSPGRRPWPSPGGCARGSCESWPAGSGILERAGEGTVVKGGAGGKRRPVVLYQPRDEGAVMPLGLLALGSWLAGEHVVIVDGRFELAPEARVVELARGALCLGVSVRTGTPLREALRVSTAARSASPDLTIVWGGAHATLDPASCLETGIVDGCILGAGEEALSAMAEALLAGQRPRSVSGIVMAGCDVADPAPLPDSRWPRADYSLLDVERHFELRGARRLDYCASRGARDGSTWMAIRAERVVAEARELAERYRLAEVLFQDEDSPPWTVEAIARGLPGKRTRRQVGPVRGRRGRSA